MNKLILLRHGQSQWNLENRFTGWKDIGLSENGELEAKNSGRLIREKKIPIYSRAEVLADVVSLKKNIIITGSHGKTTTTSLVSVFFIYLCLTVSILNPG